MRQVQRGSADCPHLSHRSGCSGGQGSPKATLRFGRLRTDLKAEGCCAHGCGSRQEDSEESQPRKEAPGAGPGGAQTCSRPSQRVSTAFTPRGNSGDTRLESHKQGRSPEPRCPEFLLELVTKTRPTGRPSPPAPPEMVKTPIVSHIHTDYTVWPKAPGKQRHPYPPGHPSGVEVTSQEPGVKVRPLWLTLHYSPSPGSFRNLGSVLLKWMAGPLRPL